MKYFDDQCWPWLKLILAQPEALSEVWMGPKPEHLAMDEKYLAYRARKISKARNISIEEALVVAQREAVEDKVAEKNSKIERLKAKSMKLTKKLKGNNKKTVYVVDGKVISHEVSGGLPTLGKRK